MVQNSVKAGLTRIGARAPRGLLVQIQATVNYLKLGRWSRDRGFEWPRVPAREDVWDAIIEKVQDRRVLYLEFGVARGYSMNYWSTHLRADHHVFHGFDSFQGLPEDGGPWIKGQFDTQGCLPDIRDDRVRFFKGWFEEVLPHYAPPAHETLVINMDADLYSSTIYVLRQLRSQIRRGTFIYFDEINHLEHEARALDDFIRESGLKFVPVCADKTLAHVAFECVGESGRAARADAMYQHIKA